MKEFSFIYLLFGGGWFLTLISLLLIAISIYSWAIMIEKWLLFKGIKKNNSIQKDLKLLNYDVNKLYLKYVGSENQTPYTRVFMSAYNMPKDKLEKLLPAIIENEMAKVEAKLGFLPTSASVAPFIGLFGTVWGVMDVFSSIGVHGSTSLQVVAPGIGMALATTAMGLIVAIPSAFGASFFNQKYDELEGSLYRFSDEMVELIQSSKKER